MKSKCFNVADVLNVLLDIILVMFIQIALVFVIIVIPCIVVIINATDGAGTASFEVMSSATMRQIIRGHKGIEALIQIAGCFAMLFAPLVYESSRCRGEDKINDVCKLYLKGLRINWRDLLHGLSTGFVYIVALTCLTMLFEGRLIVFSAIKSCSWGELIYQCIYICIAGIAQAVVSHWYIWTKTSNYSNIVFIGISCAFYYFGVSRQIDISTVPAFMTVLLNAALMTLWTLQAKGIYRNVGFYVSCGTLHYCLYGTSLSGSWISVCLLVILVCVYAFIQKRTNIVKRDM